MDTQQYEDVLSKLVELLDEEHELLLESERRAQSTEAMINKLAQTVAKIVEHNINEAQIYDKHLTRLEDYRNSVSERCNKLLEQNKILLEHNDRVIELMHKHEHDGEKLRERYDRVIDILESSILVGRGQGSAANVTFAGKDSIDALKTL